MKTFSSRCKFYDVFMCFFLIVKERLRECYENEAMRFHLTSCQFSLHYSFESHAQAHMMLRNACENLRPGGYFIGTTIDSNKLM